MPHRLKRRTLVALLKGMRPRDAGHQSDSKDQNILFAVSECIARASQRAFEKAKITNEVVLSGRRHLKPIVFDDRLYRQPLRLIWQGRPGSSETSR